MRIPQVAGGGVHRDAHAGDGLAGGRREALLEGGLCVEGDVLGDDVDAGGDEGVECIDVVGDATPGAVEEQIRSWRHFVRDFHHGSAFVTTAGVEYGHARYGAGARGGEVPARLGLRQVGGAVGDDTDLHAIAGNPLGDRAVSMKQRYALAEHGVGHRVVRRGQLHDPGKRRNRVELSVRDPRLHHAGGGNRGRGWWRETGRDASAERAQVGLLFLGDGLCCVDGHFDVAPLVHVHERVRQRAQGGRIHPGRRQT